MSELMSGEEGGRVASDALPTPNHNVIFLSCSSAIKNMKDSSVYFKSIEGLLRHAIAVKDQLNSTRR